MRAAGLGPETQQAAASDHRELFPVRHRRLAFRVADHAPAGLGGRHLGERQVDRARVAIGNAVEDREIALLDLAPLERPGEAAVRLRIAREQQTARGVRSEEHTSELQSLMRNSY